LNIGIAGNGVGTNPITGGSSEILPVLSGQSEATVKANVPADYTVPAIADFTTTEVTSINGYDWLKVSWTAPAYHPAISVNVVYSYGKDQPGLLTVNVPTITTPTEGSSYALFPLIGGDNTVSVQPVFGSTTTADANLFGTYYASPAKVEKTVTYSKTNLGSLTSASFATSRITAANNPAKLGVGISYREFAGVEGATPTVYRLETVNYTASAATSLTTGATAAGWTVVDPGFVKRTRGTDQFEYYGEDLTVEEGKTYNYALVLTLGEAKSQAATTTAISIAKASPQATVGTIGIVQVSVLNASTGSQTGTRLQISFTGDKDSTYKLQFAPNVGTGVTAATAKAGTYTDVPDAPTTVDVTGTITIGHVPPRRVSYFYKVIATNKDGISREVLYNPGATVPGLYNTSPWSAASGPARSSIISGTLPVGPSSSVNVSVQATGKAASSPAPDTLIFPGENVKIYYAFAATNGGNPLAQFASSVNFTYGNFTNDSDSSVRTKPINITGENQYRFIVYRVYLVTEDGEEIELN
jgi:hypothetical protein